jgi:MFS family permease
MVGKLINLPPALRPSFRGILAPLTIPDFQRLLSSNFLWWGARFMEMIVVGWLVLEMTNSAWQVAVVGFYRSAPFLLVGFVSGPIIDRFGRRKIILAAQVANVLIYTITAFLLWTDQIALWHLIVGSLVMGAAWSLDWPARRALLPDLVGKKKTVEALLLENFSQNVARIAGPFVAGLVIKATGASGAYTILAALSGLTLFILWGLSQQPLPRTTTLAHSSPLGNIVEGLRYVRHNPPILGVLLITMVMNFMVFHYITMLPVFARDVLQQGPVGLGLLGAAAGVGAFVGIFIINYIRRFTSSGWIFAVGSAFQALAILAFAISTSFPLSLTLLLLSGIGQACFGILQSSIILLSASDEMRSRAMGALVLAIGVGPLGQLQIGGVADALGAPWAVRINSLIAVLTIILIIMLLPGLRREPANDTEEAQMPAYAGSPAR